MRRALNLLRRSLHYRRDAFDSGLTAAGYRLEEDIRNPRPGDLLLIWNRYGGDHERAGMFERAGAQVLVVENCPLGNSLNGGSYSIARGQVAMTGGGINDRGPERWDAWGISLQPWLAGGETVILGQRGIGNSETRSPLMWAESVQRRLGGGRIRPHPGTGAAVQLAEDLKKAEAVVTWSSAAAIQALAMGVAVWHEHPAFVGAQASTLLGTSKTPKRDDAARLAVFRRLAWAIWALEEIRSGQAIRCALGD